MSSNPTDPPALPASIFRSNHRHDAPGTSRSFLQALSDTTHSPKQENGAVYVHPLVKKTSAKLSDKSLEMCTESLGSETGSDIMETTMIESSSIVRHKETKPTAKTKREYNFPPPLTSISNSLGMKTHRENGRLVITAVIVTEGTDSSLFEAERINGRLMLRLKKSDVIEVDETEFKTEDDIDETNEGEETEDSASRDDDLNANMKNMEGNIGNDENISRVGRCNEAGGDVGEKGHLWNLENFWVAT